KAILFLRDCIPVRLITMIFRLWYHGGEKCMKTGQEFRTHQCSCSFMTFWNFINSTGFGIERLGLMALRWPKAALGALLLFTLFMASGVVKVGFNADMRDVFRSNSQIYRSFEQITKIFPGSEFDAMLLVEGENLFTPERLEALRSLHLDMNFVDGVRGVISIFSVRQPPEGSKALAPVIPAELTAQNVSSLKTRLLAHPIVRGKLLSADGNLALFILSLDPAIVKTSKRKALYAAIREFAGETLSDTGLDFTLAGKPVLYALIIDELIRDQMIFKILGLTLSVLIAWVFFRNFKYVLLASLPPALATIWLFGLMGWLGINVNTLNNVVPTLVMVIAFTNAIHMLFALRRYRQGGEPLYTAMRDAVLEVGPATVLATLTTSIALLSLAATGHVYIVIFGLLAAMGALISLAVVLLVIPSLGSLILAHEPVSHLGGPKDRIYSAVLAFCLASGRAVLARSRLIALAGLALAVLAGALHSLNRPHYLYKEFMPAGAPTVTAMEKIDEKLSGASSLYIFLQWPEGHDMRDPETLEVVQKAHDILKSTRQIKQVWSLATLLEWMGADARTGSRKLFDLLQESANPTNSRLISLSRKAVLVTGFFEVLEASALVPVLDDLDARLAPLRRANPEMRIEISGISAVAAYSTSNMIWLLNRSLFLAIVFNIFLIGLCFRSLRFALYSILPNLTPIVVAGAVLYLTGQGL
ncbi:MAG TPA: hypothetical protein ENJ57_08165, partial [Rhizobiales bacterium]|nr:hypothetical protein [Hyphomicrobiales bacterium]